MIDWRQVAGGDAGTDLPAGNRCVRHPVARRQALRAPRPHAHRCAHAGLQGGRHHLLPIPPGAGSNFAGLLTINLPATVKKGQAFKVVTRQLANVSARRPVPPPILLAASHQPAEAAAAIITSIQWRKVVGTFQISIPVVAKGVLLEPEERLLSVLRWIAQAIPTRNRWHRVFERYLKQIADRVTALGGDPSTIYPSSSGDGRPRPGHRAGRTSCPPRPARLPDCSSIDSATSRASCSRPRKASASSSAANGRSRRSPSAHGAIGFALPCGPSATSSIGRRLLRFIGRRSRSGADPAFEPGSSRRPAPADGLRPN